MRSSAVIDQAVARAITRLEAARPAEDPPPSKTVFHYTNFAAFEAIASKGKLRLGETTYMNDRMELRAFRDDCVETFTRIVYGSDRSPHPRNRGPLELIDPFRVIANVAFTEPAYLASFSAKRSLLSQWRAYCPSGGVSLEFDAGELAAAAEKTGWRSGWCFYKSLDWQHDTTKPENAPTKIWRALIDELKAAPFDNSDVDAYYDMFPGPQRAIDALRDMDRKGPPPPPDWKVLMMRQLKAAYELAPLFKDFSFHEEAEFRVYTNAPARGQLEVRQGKQGPARYLEFEPSSSGTALKSVMLGPCEPEHQSAQLDALKLILERAKLGAVPVEPSNIPLRLVY